VNPFRRILSAMQPVVFLGSAAVIIAFVTFGTTRSEQARRTFEQVQSAILSNFSWFYALTTTGLLVFALWLLMSRHGKLRLGGEDARPEFSYPAWISMLFAAGMGIGLVFWGVAEPLTHFREPPAAEPESGEALAEAMRYSFFHWGLHPWGVYAVFALSLAYYHFRHGLPLAPRSLLYPLIGRRIHGLAGHAVDIVATVGTLFGVATSLGFGAMQINAGLSEIFGLPTDVGVQVAVIGTITLVATISVVSGLHLGMQFLSRANLILAGCLLLFVFAAGPTVAILETFVTSLGGYLQKLPGMSLRVDPADGTGWQGDWTFFYWSWWISWSPFVGVFTARISKGRTVREFILNVLLVPVVLTFLWLSVFGGTALELQREGNTAVAEAIDRDVALSLHALLGELPLADLSVIVALVVVIVFFITSSDSGSLVDDMVTSGGHPNPPAAQRVFWAVSEGAVAATLLVAGGLQALRTASLISGLPMALILLATAVALVRAFRQDDPGRPPDKRALVFPGMRPKHSSDDEE